MAELPGGRGIRRHEGSRIDQSESWSRRGSGVIDAPGWSFPAFPYSMDSSHSLITMEQEVVLGFLPEVHEPVDASFVRARVTTAHGTEKVRVCLYRADVDGLEERSFTRIPGTEVEIDASATGVKDVPLPSPVRLNVGVRYFLGVFSSHSSVAMPGLHHHSKSIIPNLRLSGSSSGIFPGKIKRSMLSAVYDVNVPWILFINKELKELA